MNDIGMSHEVVPDTGGIVDVLVLEWEQDLGQYLPVNKTIF